MLIKFIEEEYLEDFLAGNLYLKPISYFNDLEREKNDRVIGDNYDGKYTKPYPPGTKIKFSSLKGEHIIDINVNNAVYSEQHEKNKETLICCFVSIDDENMIDRDGKKIIDPKLLETLEKDFKNRIPIVITESPDEFASRINKAIETTYKLPYSDNNYELHHGLVSYYDKDSESMEKNEYDKDPKKAIYNKRDSYMNQKEHRFCLAPNKNEPKDFLKLKLSNIDECIKEFKSFDDLKSATF
ncbi:hypothetical protein CSI43_14255 [Listeria monocytogenes]|nr:hypothetical protein [Listeria monocytogenes]EAF3115243.1 hypothetical protein [Listeria monocytogenes]EAF3120844.1 hypothetical protein [Listeria monocytogenes]EAF3123868.1 hypothetical protein [Listeria monocytogenes]EAF3126768.1 hypothetical protein [Listeria monocytogenes]